MVIGKETFYQHLCETVPGGKKEEITDPSRRVYLTPLSMDGLEEMYQYSKDPRLYEYFEFPPQKTREETKQYLEKLLQRMGPPNSDRKAMYWFVRRVQDNRMVGTFSLVNIDYGRLSAEWGYGVDPDLWGMNYPLEMMSIIKKYAFEVLGINRLWGQTMLTNKKTVSVLLAAGCKHEGNLRDFYCKNGKFVDAWAYSILKSDYLEEKMNSAPKKPGQKVDPKEVAMILSDVLHEKVLDFEKDMESFNGWDSITHYDIVVVLQKRFSVDFTADEIIQLRSVNSIHEILEQKV